MYVGYARVSTKDQSLDLQVDTLKKAKCAKIFQEVASGAKTDHYPDFSRPSHHPRPLQQPGLPRPDMCAVKGDSGEKPSPRIF